MGIFFHRITLIGLDEYSPAIQDGCHWNCDVMIFRPPNYINNVHIDKKVFILFIVYLKNIYIL